MFEVSFQKTSVLTFERRHASGQLSSLDLLNDPSCLVFTSLSSSSWRWPRRYRYSMCMTSVFLIVALARKSSRILGMKPGLSCAARRNCRYRDKTCFCSLLWRTIVWLWGLQPAKDSNVVNALHYASIDQMCARACYLCPQHLQPTDLQQMGNVSWRDISSSNRYFL